MHKNSKYFFLEDTSYSTNFKSLFTRKNDHELKIFFKTVKCHFTKLAELHNELKIQSFFIFILLSLLFFNYYSFDLLILNAFACLAILLCSFILVSFFTKFLSKINTKELFKLVDLQYINKRLKEEFNFTALIHENINDQKIEQNEIIHNYMKGRDYVPISDGLDIKTSDQMQYKCRVFFWKSIYKGYRKNSYFNNLLLEFPERKNFLKDYNSTEVSVVNESPLRSIIIPPLLFLLVTSIIVATVGVDSSVKFMEIIFLYPEGPFILLRNLILGFSFLILVYFVYRVLAILKHTGSAIKAESLDLTLLNIKNNHKYAVESIFEKNGNTYVVLIGSLFFNYHSSFFFINNHKQLYSASDFVELYLYLEKY